MADKTKSNVLAIALGTGFAVTLATSPLVNAAENPFAANEFSNGYMVAMDHGEGKCGEGKCGEKGGEGSCGEKGGEGSCGEKDGEGKCGEGKCGH